MKASFRVISTLSLAFVLLAAGCTTPAAKTAEPTIDMDALRAEIVSTVVAQITADAPKVTPTAAPSATSPVKPTESLPTLAMPVNTLAPLSTFTAAAVTTRYPTWTPTPYTDRATLSIQSLVDGTRFSPGEDFDQKWTFKNQGFRPWTGEFYARYISGVHGSNTDIVMLPAVNQGGETTIVVDFVAPKEPGHYASNWGLVNDDGVTFFRFNFVFYVE